MIALLAGIYALFPLVLVGNAQVLEFTVDTSAPVFTTSIKYLSFTIDSV